MEFSGKTFGTVEVYNYLKRDNYLRQKINEDEMEKDLITFKKNTYKFASIKFDKSLAYLDETNKDCPSYRSFIDKYFNIVVMIDHVFDNYLIAGGSVIDRLLKNEFNDIDVFIYDMMPDDMYNSILHFINIYRIQMQHTQLSPISMTIQYQSIKIQFIIKIFKSKSHILHSFDIGGSMFGLKLNRQSHDFEYYTTSIGLFSYLTGSIIVNPCTMNERTFYPRITKYRMKHFKIILPNCKRNKIPNELIWFNADYIDYKQYPSSDKTDVTIYGYKDGKYVIKNLFKGDINFDLDKAKKFIERYINARPSEFFYIYDQNLLGFTILDETFIYTLFGKFAKKIYDHINKILNSTAIDKPEITKYQYNNFLLLSELDEVCENIDIYDGGYIDLEKNIVRIQQLFKERYYHPITGKGFMLAQKRFYQ